MPETAQGPCIAKVERWGKDRLCVVIPPNILHKFGPGMAVEVIEVRKKTVTQEGKTPPPCRRCEQIEINGEITQIVKNDDKNSFMLPKWACNSDLDVTVIKVKKPKSITDYLKWYLPRSNESEFTKTVLIENIRNLKVGDQIQISAEPYKIESGGYVHTASVAGGDAMNPSHSHTPTPAAVARAERAGTTADEMGRSKENMPAIAELAYMGEMR